MRSVTRGTRFADERGLVTGLIIRLAILAGLLGLVGYEVAAVVAAKYDAQSIADAAAVAGREAYEETSSLDAAHREALRVVRDRNPRARLRAFEVRADGGIALTVRRRANTLFVQRVGFLEGFAVATATGRADPPGPGR